MVKQPTPRYATQPKDFFSETTGSAKIPLIMIVDDEEALRMSIRFSLENYGFEVVEAENGEEAISIFSEQQPDLILMDVLMGGMDGFTTCETIRNSQGGAHVPIIMVTSLEDETTVIKSFYSGATDFVSKPLNLTILGYRIRYWIRASMTLSKLQASEERLTKAQKIAKLGHWEWELSSEKIMVRSSTPEMFGLENSLSYSEFIERVSEKDRKHVSAIIDGAIKSKKGFSVQYKIRDSEGNERSILNQGEFVEKEKPGHWSVVGVVQDITEMQHAERKIRYLAFYDSLTGLANRSLFKEHWKKVHALNKRTSGKSGIYFIDLDHFKHINDTLGHPVGDQVLIRVAERLKSVLRDTDILSRPKSEQVPPIISRVGGDEFILLATNLKSLDNAAILAQRIIDAISQPLEVKGQILNLSGSVGISIYPEDGDDIETLLKHADTAMYEAKKSGRNNYQFFLSEMNDVIKARFILHNKFRRALEQKEFTLYYQPKYSNINYDIKGVEALIRWHDPDEGIISPGAFLPFAEENNFIHEINTWVIQEACTQAQKWVTANIFEGCRMSLNISGKDIDFAELQNTICRSLKQTGLDPKFLEVELTERVMMENTEDAKKTLTHLKEMGISIAIDDFGTGYSALSHLLVFPLTTLKIDKSFVKNIEVSKKGMALLLSIINIAKSLELNVIAEGVETEKQKSLLHTMDCDELQGYLLSYPVPADDVEKLLGKSSLEEE